MRNREITTWSVAYTGMAVAFIGMGLVAIGIALLSGAGEAWDTEIDPAVVFTSFWLCASGGVATLAAAAALGWSGDRVRGPAGLWLRRAALALPAVLFICACVAGSLAEGSDMANGD